LREYGDYVVELGSGSGILGISVALAGAKKV
jgi:predicted RNA methylase